MSGLDEKGLKARITEYLAGGGLFNPELANHDAVRDLLIDCRDALASATPADVGEEPIERFGLIDENSGYSPLYFGLTNGIQPWGISGPEYVKYSDHATALERVVRERDAYERALIDAEALAETNRGYPTDLSRKIANLRSAARRFLEETQPGATP